MTLALPLLAILLSACGGDDRTPARAARDADIRPVRFGDADPHRFPGRAPQSYPVQGIDVSRWQGRIDWRQVAQAGVAFAYVKATEGGDVIDPAFASNWRSVAQAGIRRGAFHHFYWCRPAAEQARWFIKSVPKEAGALPAVLDLEWTPFSPTCTCRPDASTVRRETQVFLSMLERHYGQRPLIYTTPDFWRDTGIGALPAPEFWLRSTADRPSGAYPGQDWTFWQFTSTCLVPGISGKVDINVFAGSAADWASWQAIRAQ